MFSRSVIDNSRGVIDYSRSVTDNSWSANDDSRVMLQLAASFTIGIYNHNIFIVPALSVGQVGRIPLD